MFTSHRFKSLFQLLVVFAFSVSSPLTQSQDSTARYLANEGLMVVNGETKILFDPLFRQSYGHYSLVPEVMIKAIFTGSPPFDGVDAIFISHHHGDHFSPADILRLLKAQQGIHLYAPAQAVAGLRAVAAEQDEPVFQRVTAVDLAYKQAPVVLNMQGLLIEAVRIPHSGWPRSRLDIENIAWRVTLNDTTTVLHMGDADPNDVHFARDAKKHWDKRPPHMAFPPYWFFSSASGRKILSDRIKPAASVGVHVPVSIPTDPGLRPLELRDFDLFTSPGESRVISHKKAPGVE
jgi:L-ascorbate metabolism protein UlaG (beta-lactamase superfamily)